MGLLVGVVLNILQLLYLWARPETVVGVEHINTTPFIRVTPNIGMYYPSIVHIRELVNRALLTVEFKAPVVIECEKFAGLDYTAAQVILRKNLFRHFSSVLSFINF